MTETCGNATLKVVHSGLSSLWDQNPHLNAKHLRFRTAISSETTPKRSATLPLTCKLHMWKDNSSNGRNSHLLLIWQENRTSDVTCKTEVVLNNLITHDTPSSYRCRNHKCNDAVSNSLTQSTFKQHMLPPGNTFFKKSFHAVANEHSKRLKKQSANSNHL